eukprot:746839-Hanusia_phi.AAC.12
MPASHVWPSDHPAPQTIIMSRRHRPITDRIGRSDTQAGHVLPHGEAECQAHSDSLAARLTAGADPGQHGGGTCFQSTGNGTTWHPSPAPQTPSAKTQNHTQISRNISFLGLSCCTLTKESIPRNSSKALPQGVMSPLTPSLFAPASCQVHKRPLPPSHISPASSYPRGLLSTPTHLPNPC